MADWASLVSNNKIAHAPCSNHKNTFLPLYEGPTHRTVVCDDDATWKLITHPCCSRASASSMTTVLSSTKKLKSSANTGLPSSKDVSPDIPQSICHKQKTTRVIHIQYVHGTRGSHKQTLFCNGSWKLRATFAQPSKQAS